MTGARLQHVSLFSGIGGFELAMAEAGIPTLAACEIDKKLTDEAVRPMLYYMHGATCWQPGLKGITIQVNSIYNNWRLDDVWLE